VAQFKRIKGTQDILPQAVQHWQEVESKIRECMRRFNYHELRTPVFEQTELFARGIGQATDIVAKEMYTFLDRGKKSLTLKPEMTAPIMRSYIENNLAAVMPLTKIFYISPLFRQENPQAGRLRQFNQFGAEAIGADSAELDSEIILLALEIYRDLKVTKLNVILNSVGDPESRNAYQKVLKSYIKPLLKEYCPDCNKRYNTNPLRILDCKVDSCRELNKNAPLLIDHLNTYSADHFMSVRRILDENGVIYDLDPHLVRGLDYYTHTVFEITSDQLGSQDAICGGGRYDLLAEQFGGSPTPAVGFASGIERLIMVMESQGLLSEIGRKIDIFVAPLGAQALISSVNWLVRFRRLGYSADGDFLQRSLKAQMREANRQSAKFVLILGENELEKEVFSVKDMSEGTQQEIDFRSIESFLKRNLGSSPSNP
jgi:histidyl-tRNA synthetase